MKLTSFALSGMLLLVIAVISPAPGNDANGVVHPPFLIPKVEPGKVWSSMPEPPPPPVDLSTEPGSPSLFIFPGIVGDNWRNETIDPARFPVSTPTFRNR